MSLSRGGAAFLGIQVSWVCANVAQFEVLTREYL
jgi:hypothetical protein